MNEANGGKRLKALIDGLSGPEQPQEASGKPGDPQLSALCEFIARSGFKSESIVVDFGSGKGVLPHHLAMVYSDQKEFPEYWAVDMPDALDELSLPARIHNRSRKYSIKDFYERGLPSDAGRIETVVIRNTLHELDISETALLLSNLRKYLTPNCVLYIQDMGRLTKAERGHVAWSRVLLEKCLADLGFIVDGAYNLQSFSGTPWFAIGCRVDGKKQEGNATEVVARYRKVQYAETLESLKAISKGYENVDELMLLQHEFSVLALQLDEVTPHSASPLLDLELKNLGVPIRKPKEDRLEYAGTISESAVLKSGLIGILSSKELLDFPSLFAGATSQLSFGGYSNRPLFRREENVAALNAAADKGVRVRVLVVDPQSDAARLRAREPIYETEEGFLKNIYDTINAAREHYQKVQVRLGKDVGRDRFQLKASQRVPRWSYFIVDDTCYLSFYSTALTGSAAPCFIFRALEGAGSNYFHVAQKEFSDLFAESHDLLTDKP